jgi:hypothetical protein
MIARVRTTLAALAVIGALLALPAGARAEQASIGISDQEPGTYTDPLFSWTGIAQTRIIVPWDIAFQPDASRVDRVLQTARNTYQDILVSFEHSAGEDCAAAHGRCSLPTPAQYYYGVSAFLWRWPFVHTISPWNEANHPSQPTAGHPAMAATYYKLAQKACPTCTVLGAEVVDIDNLEDWVTRFKAALGFDPRLWGLHNYGDVTRRHGIMTRRLLALVKGDVWLTETGGLVRFQMRDGSVPWPYDEGRAARSLKYTFKLADAHQDRIRRIYIYNWRAAPKLRWDSGLLDEAGEPRPSFYVLADRLHPGAKVPAVRRLPRARVVRKPHYRRRDGRVLATVRCPKARRVRCTVVMAVRLKGRTAHRRRHGLLGERKVRVRAGHKRVLKVRVPAARRRLIRLGRTRKLRAQLWLGGAKPRQYDVRCRRGPRRR